MSNSSWPAVDTTGTPDCFRLRQLGNPDRSLGPREPQTLMLMLGPLHSREGGTFEELSFASLRYV